MEFRLPPVGFGPGSQPEAEDGAELAYMPMPSGMRTYEPRAPEVEDAAARAALTGFLDRLRAACAACARTGETARIALVDADAVLRPLIDDALGEGEVSCVVETPDGRAEAQEAVFAGVWRLRGAGGEAIEIGPAPRAVTEGAFATARIPRGLPAPGPGVVNAPAILTEVMEKAEAHRPGAPAHVVNLTLLPHTPEDLDHIARVLAPGAATLLSRGYGNCRVEATGTTHVWRVRYFNSQDALIQDLIEIGDAPDAARAAREDFEDSALRIARIIEALA